MPRRRFFRLASSTRWQQKVTGRRQKFGMAVAVAMLLGSFNHQSLAQDALTGDQVRSLITGNTLKGSFLANPLTMVFYPNGEVYGAIGLTGSDSGTWAIEGDNYCHEWVTYFSSVRRCYQWIPEGDGYVLNNVDAFRARPIQGRIEQGKPKGY